MKPTIANRNWLHLKTLQNLLQEVDQTKCHGRSLSRQTMSNLFLLDGLRVCRALSK